MGKKLFKFLEDPSILRFYLFIFVLFIQTCERNIHKQIFQHAIFTARKLLLRLKKKQTNYLTLIYQRLLHASIRV